MPPSTVAAIVFALGAAFAYGIASVWQQQEAAAQPVTDAMRPGLLLGLLRKRRWLAGLAVDYLGYGAEAIALGFGAIVVVAPLLQTGLLFALILGARATHTRLRTRDWSAAIALVFGLTVFLFTAKPEGGITRPSFADWWPWLAAFAAATALCVIVGWWTRGASRAVAWGLAAAVCYGVTGPLTKTVVDLVVSGDYASLFIGWELYALIGAAVLGMLCNQSAFQAGDLPASLPVIAIGTPILGCAIGIAVYDEHLTTQGPLEYTVLVTAVLTLIAGIFVLAQGEARRASGHVEATGTGTR